MGAVYGMGRHKFALYCAGQQIDLAAAGTSAEACIEAFRSEYPGVAGRPTDVYNGRVQRRDGIWERYDTAARRAVLGHTSAAAGRCTFARVGKDLVVTLPSGRDLVYRSCRVEHRVPAYVHTLGLTEMAKPTLVYDGPRGEAVLFGGKITENLVPAICRDLLCCALIRCQRSGLTGGGQRLRPNLGRDAARGGLGGPTTDGGPDVDAASLGGRLSHRGGGLRLAALHQDAIRGMAKSRGRQRRAENEAAGWGHV
jgi:hypothetical protein